MLHRQISGLLTGLKSTGLFLKDSWAELLGLAVLVGIYAYAANQGMASSGKELYLVEAAREAYHGFPKLFYPTYNGMPFIPVSPLLTLLLSLVFKLAPASLLTARITTLGIAGLAAMAFYLLAGRLFHAMAGALALAVALASWGFFFNSQVVNGAMLYTLWTSLAFLLFYHWFDSAFRSRTYARSLYMNFILLGIALGFGFCTFGLPGLLFPVAVMITAIILSNRFELVLDIHYAWLGTPLAAIVLLWSGFGMLAFGPWAFFSSLIPLGFGMYYLTEPLFYTLPLLPAWLPGLFNKEMWGRAILSHQRALYLLLAWLGWSVVFLVLFPVLHEAFSLLAVLPVIIWTGFYFGEIFRNPVLPKPLAWVLDAMALLGMVGGIAGIIITLQLAPPYLFLNFLILSFLLPLLSVCLILIKDMATSRVALLSMVVCGLLVCFMTKITLIPLLSPSSRTVLATSLPRDMLRQKRLSVVEWQPPGQPASNIRLQLPATVPIRVAHKQAELEAMIQTRSGPTLLVTPESVFFRLPAGIREQTYELASTRQWLAQPTPGLLWRALRDEMVNYADLTETVYIHYFPEETAAE